MSAFVSIDTTRRIAPLCCVMVALRLLVDDDDDDDTAPEVQTNFVSSQNCTMIVYFVIGTTIMIM